MKLLTLSLAFVALSVPVLSAAPDAQVYVDQAEFARTLIPYEVNRMTREMGLSEDQRQKAAKILAAEADRIAAIQKVYLENKDMAGMLRSAVDLNLQTASEIQKILTPDQAGKTRAFLEYRRKMLSNHVEVILNGYWYDAALKAGLIKP